MLRILLPAAFLFTLLIPSTLRAQALEEWNGHLYGTTPGLSWLNAEAYAVAQGGHLVTIDNLAENDFLYLTYVVGGADHWIGFHCPDPLDYLTISNWEWIDGSPVTLQRFRPGQPDWGGGADRYAVIGFTGSDEWDNYPEHWTPTGIYEIDPFLSLDGDSLSASSGVPLHATVDFPDSEGGIPFAVLLSLAGTGPTNLNGVDVPLTSDTLMQKMLTGWTPAAVTGTPGVLDADGDGSVTFLSHAMLTPYVGQTVYVAAISYTGVQPRLSSWAREFQIVL